MTRSRGGLRRGRSASVSGAGMAAASGTQSCGTCAKDVGDEAIGCDECETWVHNSEMCSGLTQDMLDAISRYQGSGIKFVCMKCRVSYMSARGNSPTSSTEPHMAELVQQLFQQIKGISNVVQELVAQVKVLSSHPKPQPPESTSPSGFQASQAPSYAAALNSVAGLPNPNPPADEYRTLVREELRELEEQRKRRNSLVVRGLKANSAQEAVTQFEKVAEHLIQQKVILVDVVRIPSETDLYRGKVLDDSVRKLILEKAKSLKDSAQFGTVFIRRDLTYNQRKELRSRRPPATTTYHNSMPRARPNSDPQGQTTHVQTTQSETHPTLAPSASEQAAETIPKRPVEPHTPSVSNE